MILVKLKSGAFLPAYDSDKIEADKIAPGDEVKATKARNVKFHRKAFALLKLGFDNQDKFTELELYRKVMIIKAGYYDEVPSKRGIEYMPKSLSFEKMSAETFEKWFEDTLTIIAEELQTKPDEIKREIEGYY